MALWETTFSSWTMLDINSLTLSVVNVLPSIAQLVERRTVVVGETSLGRWFESGSKDYF